MLTHKIAAVADPAIWYMSSGHTTRLAQSATVMIVVYCAVVAAACAIRAAGLKIYQLQSANNCNKEARMEHTFSTETN